MASIQCARHVIFRTYLVGALAALAFLAAESRMQGMAGLVLLPLATAVAALLGIALGVGSVLGTVALVHGTAWRAQDVMTVGLGWLSAIALIIYAAALRWY